MDVQCRNGTFWKGDLKSLEFGTGLLNYSRVSVISS